MILKQFLEQHIFFIRIERWERRIQQIKHRFKLCQWIVVKPLKLLTIFNHLFERQSCWKTSWIVLALLIPSHQKFAHELISSCLICLWDKITYALLKWASLWCEKLFFSLFRILDNILFLNTFCDANRLFLLIFSIDEAA
jgi:hypothetical protein